MRTSITISITHVECAGKGISILFEVDRDDVGKQAARVIGTLPCRCSRIDIGVGRQGDELIVRINPAR